MKIQLKQLQFRNFKKLRDLTLNFDSQINNIAGANGVGKSSILDGFNWLLFGKNSENKTDFSIKTLDSNNKAIPKLEHEVTGILIIDGKEVKLQRVYKEKYTKKRGSAIEEFTGHIQEFFVDDVPMKESEYNSYISSIFGNDFRLLSDCRYFNEVLKWEDRRRILIEAYGDVTFDDVIKELPELDMVVELLQKNERTIDEQRKVLSSKKSKVKESLESIPARLDENDRQFQSDLTPISELQKDKSEIELKIQSNRKAISDVMEKQNKVNENNRLIIKRRGEIEMQIQEEKQNLTREKRKQENELTDEIQGLNNTKSNYIKSKNFASQSIENDNTRIQQLKAQSENLLQKYKAENEKVFDSNSLVCNSCNQPLPKTNQDVLISNFNSNKSALLKSIIEEANSIKKRVDDLKLEIENNRIEISKLDELINATQVQIDEKTKQLEIIRNLDTPATSDTIDNLTDELNALIITENTIDNSELEDEIKDFESQIKAIDLELAKHEQNKTIELRRKELEQQQEQLINEFNEIERFEYQIQQFNKAFITKVEQSINSAFEVVKFKMFEEQINGGERPICVCTVDGVPYPDLNTASKVNAGLDIIQAMQRKLQVIAPIFIDNRESVTQIIPTQAQVINLIVDASAKKLTIQ